MLGWRDVPVDNRGLGESVKPTEPAIRQIFIGRGANCADQDAFERKLFVIRKSVDNHIRESDLAGREDYYVPSMSSRTLVYKGMLLATQVGDFYLDLRDERMVTALALVHQRFSTNTFPTWDLAHPFRMIAHNGEINTLRGNVNWMAARRHTMASEILGEDLDKIWPLIPEGQSDSACFDNALELLVMGGYSLAHAMMLLIPEAWAGNELMDTERRAFYEYHAALMEPWDGPAAVAFTDGRQIGATLDRNGLRPARYLITSDDKVVMASEMGVLDIPEERIVKKWRLQPGKMFLIDMEQGRIIDDAELKAQLAARQALPGLARPHPDPPRPAAGRRGDPWRPDEETLLDRQQAFGYTAGGDQVPADPDGADRPGGHRLHGRRQSSLGAVEPAQAPVDLFQAELRPGDQSAHRPDPRRDRDVAGVADRPASQPAGLQRRRREHAPGGRSAGADQRGPGARPPHRGQHRRRLPHQDPEHVLSGGRGRRRYGRRPGGAVRVGGAGRCSRATTS